MPTETQEYLTLPTPLAFEEGICEVDIDLTRIDAWTGRQDYIGFTAVDFDSMVRGLDSHEHAGWVLRLVTVWS